MTNIPPHLEEATRRRSLEAQQRMEKTLRQSESTLDYLSVSQLARRASVSTSWLYRQPQQLARAKAIAARPRPDSVSRLRRKVDSLKREVAKLQRELSQLRSENSELRARLSRLLNGQRLDG